MVLIENVRGITFDFVGSSHIEKRRNFADELGDGLRKHYHVYTDTIRCSEYGIPQQRPRFFLIGILKAGMRNLVDGDDPFTRLRSSRDSFLLKRGIRAHVTCRQAISDLESGYANIGPSPDTEGYECLLTKAPRTAFQRLMRDGFDGPVPDTRLAQHRAHIVERFRKIIAECHETSRLGVQLNQSMRERYGINKMATRVLDPASVAPTITSMPDDLLHYLEPRTLTVRENARLQSFPDWFAFQGKYTSGGKRRAKEVPRFTQVANAVPPLIAEMWGEVLLSYASSLRKISKERLAA
jgi:DNA (cytosine-5)-methyltransferase 1